MKADNNKIDYLKEHISWVENNLKEYMSSISEQEINIGKEMIKAYNTLELAIAKPLPYSKTGNHEIDMADTFRSDGRNQLIKKIFENLDLDLEAFYADFIINELKDLLESTEVYVEIMDDGAFIIYEDIKDKDDYFIAYLNYNLEYKECNSNRLYYKN